MKNVKIASVCLAAALALSLAACGTSGDAGTASTESASAVEATSTDEATSAEDATSSESSEPSAEATGTEDATSAEAAADEADNTIYSLDHEGSWYGQSSDGGAIYYEESSANGLLWEVIVVPGDPSNVQGAILIIGIATKSDDGISVKDINTDEVVDVTFLSESDSELTIKVGDVQATLTPCAPEDLIAGEDAVYDIWYDND